MAPSLIVAPEMDAEDKVNILLVDDQAAKLLTYEAILADLGENLFKATSANQALELLLRNEVAVVLIDVCMPDLDGFELAALIRQHPRFQATALIFVSAVQVADIDLLRGYAAGAVDYVPVPVIPDLLRAKVRVFAELYRKTKQLETLNRELERRVAQRTAELETANAELERRVEMRTREREAALAQIHEMQKLESLGKLTGGVAHDFNNLLTAVLGNLELLRKYVEHDARQRRLVDSAIQGAERGATLTNRMLAFARRQELRPETIHLPTLIEGMAEMLSRSLGPSIEISIDLDPEVPPARVDPNQLELAILNLALNGRDAMTDGGRLTITARTETLVAGDIAGLPGGHYVCIAVTDTGSGMDDAILKRATEPFFTTKSPGHGTGLGLSMVDGLVAQSYGAMRILSEKGRGTRVELRLPVSDLPVVKNLDAVRPKGNGAGPWRILLVDDDPIVAASTSAMLEDLGHSIVEADSARRALEVLRSDGAIDAVITDHAMPGTSGTELAAQVRREWPHLPVGLISGYTELSGELRTDLPRLAKPYRQEQLADLLATLVHGESAGQAVSGQAVSGQAVSGQAVHGQERRRPQPVVSGPRSRRPP
ncbi:MAG TPA: response regulator [Stellaceae bacterium]|nr:response regulator [Stellaceae bacterium]